MSDLLRQISIRNAEGKTLRASVHCCRPNGGAWVVFCHGLTGHRLGPHYLYVKISRALEAAGVSSLRFDFAGSGESEGRFPDMTVATMLGDLLAVIRHVRRRYAPSKLVLLGHSLGGCVAAMATAKTTVDGLVLLAPVADPLGVRRRRHELEKNGPNKRGFFENGPHEMGLPFLLALQGVNPVADMAGHLRGGLLMFQGDADPSISVAESGAYVTAARKARIPVTSRLLKNVDHNFSTVAAVEELCAAIPRWVKERMKG